jgi:hypothetical protein
VSALADVLAELAERGLLGRVTDVVAGDVHVTLLAAPKEQRVSDEMRERQAIEDHNSTLFASA